MDSQSLAVVGVGLSTAKYSDRNTAWNEILRFGPSLPVRSSLLTCKDVVESVLREARAWGDNVPQAKIAVLFLGEALSLQAADLTESFSCSVEVWSRARTLLATQESDMVVVCSHKGDETIAFACRRFRAAWRARQRCYAVLRDKPFEDPSVSMHMARGDFRSLRNELGVVWFEGLTPCSHQQAMAQFTMLLSLHDRVLPPGKTADTSPESPYYSCTKTRPWFHGDDLFPRRALYSVGARELYWEESPTGLLDSSFRRVASRWPNEVFLLSAPTRQELIERIDLVEEWSTRYAEPATLARGLAEAPLELHRLAVIAPTMERLRKSLARARKRLSAPDCERFSLTSGVYYGSCPVETGKIVFVFPGQGSQYPDMLRDTCLAFPMAQSLFDRFDEECPEGFPKASEFLFPIEGADRAEDAQQVLMGEEGAEAITLGAQICHDLWRGFALEPELLVGYSIGELSALVAAEILPVQRQDITGLMSELTRSRTPGGRSQYPSIAVSGAPRELVDELLAASETPLYLALDSCPSQIVLAGFPEAIDLAVEELRKAGASVVRLRFDRGYHTPLYERKARRLRSVYDSMPLQPGRVPVFSCISLDYFSHSSEEIRELALSQWTSPVRFREAVDKLYQQGVRTFLEVGAGARLTGFLRDCLRGRESTVLASDAQGRGLREFQQSFCRLVVGGYDLDPKAFFQGREVELDVEFQGPQRDEARLEPISPIKKAQPQGDPHLFILQNHMDLMQDFLATQNRIHSRLSGQPVAELEPPRQVPVVQKPRYPLLPVEPRVSDDLVVWEFDWTSETLPLLLQHALGNRCAERDLTLEPLGVVPLAFVVELMAQAAESRFEEAKVIEVCNIRALQWLANDTGRLSIRVEVSGQGLQREVKVFEVKAEGAVLTYSALVKGRLGWPERPVPAPPPKPLEPTLFHSGALFYEFAFHGSSLQGVQRVTGHGPEGLEMEMVVPERKGLLREQSPDFVLNPVLLDSMGQCQGYWLLEHHVRRNIGLYPYRIQSYQLFRQPAFSGEKLHCRAHMEFDGQRTKAHFDLLDQDGCLVARVVGSESLFYALDSAVYRYLFIIDYESYLSREVTLDDGTELRVLDCLDRSLLTQSGAIWRRGLAFVSLTAKERVLWSELTEDEQTPWLLRRLAVKEVLRQWSPADFLPADIDCGNDGLTPGGQSFGLLRPFPVLAVAIQDTVCVAGCAKEGERIGLVFDQGDRQKTAVRAARFAVPEFADWEVLPGPNDKEYLNLRCAGGNEVSVRFHRLGDRLLAVCKGLT
jgi:malonyl CoA-acyl carrier protein transacylase